MPLEPADHSSSSPYYAQQRRAHVYHGQGSCLSNIGNMRCIGSKLIDAQIVYTSLMASNVHSLARLSAVLSSVVLSLLRSSWSTQARNTSRNVRAVPTRFLHLIRSLSAHRLCRPQGQAFLPWVDQGAQYRNLPTHLSTSSCNT